MALIRIALWVCPFAWVHHFCTQGGDLLQSTQEADPALTASIVRAVRLVGTYLPKSTCLVEAYTLHFLLRQHKLYTEIHVGVKRQSATQITAHAWVEYNQQILLGELPNLDQYIPLYSIQRVAQ